MGSGRIYKKIMNCKKTVTIGIPAHNEEANIKNLLNAILAQNFDWNKTSGAFLSVISQTLPEKNFELLDSKQTL